MTKITIQTKIKAPIETVFNLSRNIDIHLLSTSQTNEKAVAGKTSGLIELMKLSLGKESISEFIYIIKA